MKPDDPEPRCKFQSVILNIARNKLNLMLIEVCQLKEAVDIADDLKLTQTILEKIAQKEIVSAHVSPLEAINFLKLFEEFKSAQKTNRASFKKNHSQKSVKSVFHDSPFS